LVVGRVRASRHRSSCRHDRDHEARLTRHSILTDEEKRALTLHHKRAYEAADALVEKAKADRTAIADLAKSDLGKGALADIKDMILATTRRR
jgi:hypothetical protein